jgi:DNA-directed RNA polymerase subunit RPC12/RpoP
VTPAVAFACRKCAAPVERAIAADAPPAPCTRCGEAVVLDASALADGRVVGCPVCGGEMLFKQKDFNQRVGLAVVVVAAVLAPFTWYASLGIAALVDALLYALAGEVVICYRVACRAHVRGVPPGPKVGPFDLSIHDYHRMRARRDAQGLAGPDPSTGPPLDSTSHR